MPTSRTFSGARAEGDQRRVPCAVLVAGGALAVAALLVAVYAGGTVVRPTAGSSSCSFVYWGNAAKRSVAVRMPSGLTRGYCACDGCLVPLDSGSPSGFAATDGDVIELPLQVCRDPRGLELVTSERCTPKTAEVPACGEWSSLGSGRDGNDPSFVLDLREAATC